MFVSLLQALLLLDWFFFLFFFDSTNVLHCSLVFPGSFSPWLSCFLFFAGFLCSSLFSVLVIAGQPAVHDAKSTSQAIQGQQDDEVEVGAS